MGDDIEGLEVGLEPVTRSDQMYQVFETRKMVLMGLEAQPFDEDDPDAWTEDTYTVFGDADGNQVAWVGTPEPITDADLEQLRTDEIAMWQTDWDCQDDAGVRDLQERIEQELVDELLAEFPELADARAERAEDS